MRRHWGTAKFRTSALALGPAGVDPTTSLNTDGVLLQSRRSTARSGVRVALLPRRIGRTKPLNRHVELGSVLRARDDYILTRRRERNLAGVRLVTDTIVRMFAERGARRVATAASYRLETGAYLPKTATQPYRYEEKRSLTAQALPCLAGEPQMDGVVAILRDVPRPRRQEILARDQTDERTSVVDDRDAARAGLGHAINESPDRFST